MPSVTLEAWELELGAVMGVRRQARSTHTLANKYGAERNWNVDIEGACGELAVAKLFGRYWCGGVDNFGGCDVRGLYGASIQVRTSALEGAHLIVRPSEPDDHFFVLVVARCPEYEVKGWIRGWDAKRREWLFDANGRQACFMVPQDALEPVA